MFLYGNGPSAAINLTILHARVYYVSYCEYRTIVFVVFSGITYKGC